MKWWVIVGMWDCEFFIVGRYRPGISRRNTCESPSSCTVLGADMRLGQFGVRAMLSHRRFLPNCLVKRPIRLSKVQTARAERGKPLSPHAVAVAAG